jgi:hypothetical protein
MLSEKILTDFLVFGLWHTFVNFRFLNILNGVYLHLTTLMTSQFLLADEAEAANAVDVVVD